MTAESHGYGIYWIIWGVLLVLTFVMISIGEANISYLIKGALLLVGAATKALLIIFYFMHLRLEKAGLAVIVLVGIFLTGFLMFALPAVAALRAAGYGVAVIGNQPAARTEQLRALGFDLEVIAMSAELGVAKPDPAFFDRVLELVGWPDPASVAYVGDRVGNDVLPAAAAGMRAVWIRRGPWGVIEQLPEGVAPALVVNSLTELAERIGEAWAGLPVGEASG